MSQGNDGVSRAMIWDCGFKSMLNEFMKSLLEIRLFSLNSKTSEYRPSHVLRTFISSWAPISSVFTGHAKPMVLLVLSLNFTELDAFFTLG